MKIQQFIRFLLGVFVFLSSFALATAGTLTVFAAASLTDVMTDIGKAYQQKTGEQVVFNFAGSNLLERQIEAGAPADVFVSADDAKMDSLEGLGLVVKGSRKELLTNSLVVVAPKGSALSVDDLTDLTDPAFQRIALADPRAVPAGIYARKCLEKAGVWSEIAERVIPTANVRAALAAVASGNVDVGLVYRTDAAISKEVTVLFSVPESEEPAIHYPVAVMRATSDEKAAQKFVSFLESPAAGKTFKHYGFKPVAAEVKSK